MIGALSNYAVGASAVAPWSVLRVWISLLFELVNLFLRPGFAACWSLRRFHLPTHAISDVPLRGELYIQGISPPAHTAYIFPSQICDTPGNSLQNVLCSAELSVFCRMFCILECAAFCTPSRSRTLNLSAVLGFFRSVESVLRRHQRRVHRESSRGLYCLAGSV